MSGSKDDAGTPGTPTKIKAEELRSLHGKRIAPADVPTFEQWNEAFEAKKIGKIKDRAAAHKIVSHLLPFLTTVCAQGRVRFTWDDYRDWVVQQGEKPKQKQSWAKNDVGAFNGACRDYPLRVSAEPGQAEGSDQSEGAGKTEESAPNGGLRLGFAIVGTGPTLIESNEFCLVFRRSDRDRVAPVLEDTSGQLFEVKGAPAPASVEETPACRFVAPQEIVGRERNHDWMLGAIMYLDGVSSADQPGYLGPPSPDIHEPDVIKAARQKLETEHHGYRFLRMDGVPMGYASLWRIPLESRNDLIDWIRSDGTMKHPKTLLGREGPVETPEVCLAYVSSLRIHPRYRVDEPGLGSPRWALFRAVIDMLVGYAESGRLFTELIVWTSHEHEREFLLNLGGELEEIANLIRIPLWPLPTPREECSPETARVATRILDPLAKLYNDHAAVLEARLAQGQEPG